MTEITSTPPLVTVFGGSGFVGRHVVRALARRGYRIRVACRRPNLAGHLQPIGNVGQIQLVQANLRSRASVDHVIAGSDHVINLVAILNEHGKQTFDAVNDFGARAVAEAARAVGAKLTHISAIGADGESPAEYARTKAEGEQAVFETLPDSVVIRPSIVFGPEDEFFNRFAGMARYSLALPLIGGGKTRLQPVYVGDLAEAIALTVDGVATRGTIYEIGGPEVLTFRDCMEEMLQVIGRKRMLMSLPWSVSRMLGSILGILPGDLLTRDQVEMLRSDNVVSDKAEAEGRTMAAFDIEPRTIDAVLPSYLWKYRAAGQFSREGTI